MSKKLALIGLGVLIASTPLVIAPMVATGQVAIPRDMTGRPSPGSGIRGGALSRRPTPAAWNIVTMAKTTGTQCAEEAKAKGLQGKLRKRFVAQCRKA